MVTNIARTGAPPAALRARRGARRAARSRPAAPARERLLEAALRLVSERGYLGATTRLIAAAAGVSEVTLFRQFGTKARLFQEMLERYTFLPRLRRLIGEAASLPCAEALREIARGYLATLHERRDLVKIMLAEVSTYPRGVRRVHGDFIGEMDATLAGYFTALQDRGELRGFPARVAAEAFLRMLFAHFTVEELVRGGAAPRANRERTVRLFVELFLGGMRPAAPAGASR